MYRMSFGKSISQINSCQEEDKFCLLRAAISNVLAPQRGATVPTNSSSTSTTGSAFKIKLLGLFSPHSTYGIFKVAVPCQRSPVISPLTGTVSSCSDPCSANFPCICTETAPLGGNLPSTRSGRNTTSVYFAL